MMVTILLTVVIFLLAITGLGVGVLNQRNPLKGSCGGCTNCLCKGAKKHD